jgi:transposase
VTGALTVFPVQKRLGLYCSIASSHITGDDVFAFVQQLRSHLKYLLLVSWDRFSGHTARLLHDVYGHRVQVEFLSAYASELNVVEQRWGHTKVWGTGELHLRECRRFGASSRLLFDGETSTPRVAARLFPACTAASLRCSIDSLKDQ